MTMRMRLAVLICMTTMVFCAATCAAATSADSRWTDRVIPMPKEITVPSSVTLTGREIFIQPCALNAPQMEMAQTLLKSFALGTEKGKLTISLHLAADAAAPLPPGLRDRLAKLDNASQAYAICSNGAQGTIALIANSPTGLVYAARTLQMLVAPPEKFAPGDRIEVPLPQIVDWPDMEERGIWGMGSDAIAPLARWKVNMMEMHAGAGCDDDGNLTLGLTEETVRSALAQGIKVVPYIPHIDGAFGSIVRRIWGGNGKIKAKYEAALTPAKEEGFYAKQQSLCMQHPITEQIVATWLTLMAERIHKYSNDVEIWFSEGVAPCGCPKCQGKNAYLLELECFNRALKTVQKQYPDLRLRLFLSQGTANYEDSNNKIIEALPKGIGLTYYHGQKTYLTDRNPMVPENLGRFAKAGGWLGIVPSIGANIRTYVPFTSPQHVRLRISEFVEKKLNSMSLFVPPAVEYNAYGIAMAAEWSWNLKGRSMADAARAYATITGMKDPKAFAEWAVLIGEPNQDLHEQPTGDSSFQTWLLSRKFGASAHYLQGLKTGRLADKTVFASHVAAVEQALAMARKTGEPLMVLESEYTLGMLRAYAVIDGISNALAAKTVAVLPKLADDLDKSSDDVRNALTAWGKLMDDRSGYTSGHKSPNPDFTNMDARLRNMTYALARLADGVRAVLKARGIPDPRPETRVVPLGKWNVNDFSKGEATKLMDITDKVDRKGGFYHVILNYVDGYPVRGVGMTVLLRGPGDAKDKPVFQCPDVWTDIVRMSRQRHVEHRIVVPPTQPNTRVLVNIQLHTGDKSRWATFPEGLPADKKICDGEIGLRRVYQTGEQGR